MQQPTLWTGLLIVALTCTPGTTARDRGAGAEQQSGQAKTREELAEMYAIWGRARVDVDRATLEELLAPDFQLILDGKKSTREEFLDQVTRPGSARLTRFDVDVLTLRLTGSTWTAVIAEKLEWELRAADGEPKRICDLWVTRDVCGKDGEAWQFHSSEAIGNENWPPGVKPPVRQW